MESCRRYRVICISRKTEILHNWSNLIAPAALDVSKICRDKNRDTSMKIYLKKKRLGLRSRNPKSETIAEK